MVIGLMLHKPMVVVYTAGVTEQTYWVAAGWYGSMKPKHLTP